MNRPNVRRRRVAQEMVVTPSRRLVVAEIVAECIVALALALLIAFAMFGGQ